jgi:hypothetical protein
MCKMHGTVIEPDTECPEPGCDGHHGYYRVRCDERCPERPPIEGEAYRRANGRAHYSAPFMPAPSDWSGDRYGWTVHTLCGRVLRRCEPIEGQPNLCRDCAQRAVQRSHNP